MQDSADCFSVWEVCRLIFVLSDGQADVERGFNMDSELAIESCVITCLQTKVICTITKLIKSCCLAAKGLAWSMTVTLRMKRKIKS